MADPGSMVTYHDPNDPRFDYFNYVCDDGPNPSLADLSSPALIINEHPIHGTISDQATPAVLADHPCTMDTFLQPDDPSLWNGIFDCLEGGDTVPGDHGMGPSNYNDNNQAQQPSIGETSSAAVAMAGTSGTGGYSELLGMMGKAVPVWPPDPVPFFCSCCTVLRELVHSDGVCTTKLDIHGRIGIISHAILEIRDSAKSFPAVPEYQMFDFCTKSIMDVEQFMRQYCYDRLRAGFLLLPDPLSLFYRSLCVGFEWDLADSCNQNVSNSAPVNLGEQETNNKGKGKGKSKGKARAEGESAKNGGKKQSKSALSKQRARTKLMSLKDFQGYFHLPIRIAAKMIDLCPTVVKNKCRDYGLPRWPYRKINSYLKKIEDLQPLLESTSPDVKANAEAETKRLGDLIAQIYAIANRNILCRRQNERFIVHQ